MIHSPIANFHISIVSLDTAMILKRGRYCCELGVIKMILLFIINQIISNVLNK